MNRLIRFFIDLAVPLLMISAGGFALRMDTDNDVIKIVGLALVVLGLIRMGWICLRDGISPFGD